ncbi:MAG: phage portal protein [Phycisphaeraceae bacterium]
MVDLLRPLRALAGRGRADPPAPRPHGLLRARYDAAQTTEENRRHWANADYLSADAAASPETRALLRNRSRYEAANNSFCSGLVVTLANDCVGTGPRLQMGTNDSEMNSQVERKFAHWTRAVRLAEKLRTMRMGVTESGEVFGVLSTNPRVDSPVKLEIKVIEPDQIATPSSLADDDRLRDGILFDEFGNPVAYHVLKHHPGDTTFWSPGSGGGHGDDFDVLPAEAVVHLYRAERPGQTRGVPELTPALPLFAQLRRYRLAVLNAAETAASFAMPIYTDAPPNGEAEPLEPMDIFEYERGMGMVLPNGWKPAQMKAEHPSTNHVDFINSVWNEIARCVVMPLIIASGDSSDSNYASGRLDRQTYHKAIRIDQERFARTVLDHVFKAWLSEAALIEDYLPQPLRSADALERFDHQWFWDGFEHVDPAKEANAQATRLKSRTTSLASEYAKQGHDWETELRQIAREKQLMRELGISEDEAAPNTEHDTDEDESDATEGNKENRRRSAA